MVEPNSIIAANFILMGTPNTTNKNNKNVKSIIEDLVEKKRIENEALRKFLLLLEKEKAYAKDLYSKQPESKK